jgi:hypothetical protein
MAEDKKSSKTKYIESKPQNLMTRAVGAVSRGMDKVKDKTGGMIDLTQEEQYKKILERSQKNKKPATKSSPSNLKQFHSTTGMSMRGEDVEKKAKGGFIKKAIKKPGALRSSLGVKKGEKIPAAKLAKAAKAPGKMGQRARLAKTLKGFKK